MKKFLAINILALAGCMSPYPTIIPGPQGPAGTNSTTITPVQFCVNSAPSYPSTFPESGLCIGGNIYAVYSANDGFLSLIPPGNYTSDGIGESCNFTVLINCEVQDD